MPINPTKIILKHSFDSGSVPDKIILSAGEIALNAADRKIFFLDADGEVDVFHTDLGAEVAQFASTTIQDASFENVPGDERNLIITYNDLSEDNLGNIRGATGVGLNLVLTYDYASELPTSGSDPVIPAYLQVSGTAAGVSIANFDGDTLYSSTHVWVYNQISDDWTDLGELQGADGTNGIDGSTGITGAQGSSGATGQTGLTGVVGSTGITGVTGATGIQGPPDGATGIQGPIGPLGATGIIGPVGATGIQGILGSTGATGIQGPIGFIGEDGATGIQGVIGATGIQGPTGLLGATGLQGIQGIQGIMGFQGQIGATGLPSPTGAVVTLDSNFLTTKTAVTGNIIVVDTSGAPATITPIISPLVSDYFTVVDGSNNSETNPITITTSSQKIHGAPDDYLIDISRDSITLVWTGATMGWIISN